MMASSIHFLIRFSGLFLFWFCLSGKTSAFHLICGALTALGVSLGIKTPSGTTLKKIASLPAVGAGILLYSVWLMSKIIPAAIHVTYVVWHPKLPIDPGIITHKSILSDDTEKVFFGNSVTLTPGTITAEMSGNTVKIHQLDRQSSADIISHEIEKRIQKVFRRSR